MALTVEERIIRLRRGIASKETPDNLRKVMEADLEELLNPKVEAPIEPQKPVKKERKQYTKKEKPKVEVAPVIEVKAPEPPVLTNEDKARLKEQYARKQAKKREKQED